MKSNIKTKVVIGSIDYSLPKWLEINNVYIEDQKKDTLIFGEKISADKKAPIEAALSKLKDAHKAQDMAALDAAMTEMNTAWTAASEEIYKAQAQGDAGQPQEPTDTGTQASNDQASNVEDAQFEEVK